MGGDRITLATAGIGAALVATCCAAPLLAVTLGAFGVVAWIAQASYLLVPLLLILVALIGIGLYRRRTTPQASCNPAASIRLNDNE